ncbi:MAG: preprotein translocase subunit SecA [Candidatus Omnitrophica bacterium]|nr:preprotein translocase subunit SecA [Candidatus Omnitrophota bacterium]
MLKNIVIKSSQAKISRLKPKVNITFNKELPTPSIREISRFAEMVSKVNSYEEEMLKAKDDYFKVKTSEYRDLISRKIASLNFEEWRQAVDPIFEEILPHFFAMVREAARRTLNMRHFDVQILGGIILNKNKIAEMVTGEGKTLVATLPASLNALVGAGVHIVTVNDYLAKRDMEWMSPIFEFLGFSVGVIQNDMEKEERRLAYSRDITYGTNNEFGFDYLRDNMVNSLEAMVQRHHYFAIVDEVDSILIDEARTPLIISGPAESNVQKYYAADKVIRQLRVKRIIQSFDNKDETVTIKNTDGSETTMTPAELDEKYDAIFEEKNNHAYFTSQGERRCEKLLSVSSISDESPDSLSNPWSHYLTQSLTAHYGFAKNVKYIIKEGKVLIVDEFTGRLMPGRRWSDGLHQAVEAKEGLRIQEESQTLATITLQNYFRMYQKLAGMTGTAYTEANELNHIYSLDVTVVPTNRPLLRVNESDRIYKNKRGKFNAVIEEIIHMHQLKRPVLVGTVSIEDSEELSFLLGKKGIEHNVLNAKYHEKEASIVAQAGRPSQVTIATNMAGRGTDIILGGNLDFFIKDILFKNNILADNPQYNAEYSQLHKKYKENFSKAHEEVVSLGGLHIIGTQRHEARRIDNQLRGRSGRQGDPGSSRFYVSLEDDLMRLFGSERIYSLMETLGFSEDQPIEHPIINHSLSVAQKRVENHNFEIRKQLLQFDNVMNKQREVIYRQRREILESADFSQEILSMVDDVVAKNLPFYFQEERDLLGLEHWIKSKFDLQLYKEELGLSEDEIKKILKDKINETYRKKEKELGPDNMRQMEKMLSLWVVDSRWKEHLLTMDHMREGIHLRAHAHVDPLVEYQKETFFAFEEMVSSIKEGIVEIILRAKIKVAEKETSVFSDSPKTFVHSQYSPLNKKEEPGPVDNPKPSANKVGRNDPCPCGSGKKFKKCCGA